MFENKFVGALCVLVPVGILVWFGVSNVGVWEFVRGVSIMAFVVGLIIMAVIGVLNLSGTWDERVDSTEVTEENMRSNLTWMKINNEQEFNSLVKVVGEMNED